MCDIEKRSNKLDELIERSNQYWNERFDYDETYLQENKNSIEWQFDLLLLSAYSEILTEQFQSNYEESILDAKYKAVVVTLHHFIEHYPKDKYSQDFIMEKLFDIEGFNEFPRFPFLDI